jgi:CheY-like chemotaxis protein
MDNKRESIVILIADDDEDDRGFIKKAWEKSRLVNDLRFVEDGEEFMDYMYHRGKYSDPASSPSPGLILLDLNMPKKDGQEALREIKADPELRSIPIIVLTTSKTEEDIYRSYNLGANSFITKPVTFGSLAEVIQVLGQYWVDIVDLPQRHIGG